MKNKGKDIRIRTASATGVLGACSAENPSLNPVEMFVPTGYRSLILEVVESGIYVDGIVAI